MKEKVIIIFSIFVSIVVFFIVAKDNLRRSIGILLFTQSITWVLGLLVTEFKLIRYPVKILFTKSYKGSFEFEYIILPIFCVLFTLYYPQNYRLAIKVLYYSSYTLFITLLETYAIKKTKTIKFLTWHLYFSTISIALTFSLAHNFDHWFFKNSPEKL